MTLETLTLNLLYSTAAGTGLAAALDCLEADETMSPQYYGFDERKRLPYSRPELEAAPGASPVLLWRQKAVQYQGQITRSPGAVNQVLIRSTKTSAPEAVAAFYKACTAVVEAVGFEYAVLHERFEGFKTHDPEFLAGYSLKTFNYAKNGPNGIGVRTWFGKALVESIGRDRFTQYPLATPAGDGGVRLDLVAEPGKADFETLLAAHRAAYAPLRDTGVFSDPDSRTKGRVWTKLERPKSES